MSTSTIVDYVIVIYCNYYLLDLQIQNFKRRFNKKDYRLIVVDNTPDDQKIDYSYDKSIVDVFIKKASKKDFDGISHGSAIDTGLLYCTSDIVCILDSDFFLLNNDIHTYIQEKFNAGYRAVGSEFNDGTTAWDGWIALNPKNFENIPCCFGAYYDRSVALSDTWVIQPHEVQANRSTGFVEVGFKIRQHILNNNISTLSWKTEKSKPCFFKSENNTIMGVHCVAGSHARNNEVIMNEMTEIIHKDYNGA